MYILSALYGLVGEEQVLEPYGQTLNTARSGERRAWAARTLAQLAEVADLGRDRFLLLAGDKYAEFLRPLLAKVEEPLRGMPIGRRVQFLQQSNSGGRRQIRVKPARNPSATGVESACEHLHLLARDRPRFRHPFPADELPPHGIYLLFETGEHAHGGERIVRIGTHTGKRSRLADRLAEHFVNENKDRSILRKNVGRALLHCDDDPYLEVWNRDRTSSAARACHAARLRPDYQAQIEKCVTAYMRKHGSFAVLPESRGREHLRDVEKGLIGTVAGCPDCGPSAEWLGNHSPDRRIARSGLWQVQHLKAPGLSSAELRRLFS